MSQFPACKHRTNRVQGPRRSSLTWVAAEPFRVFFITGGIWSIVAVALWPLYYAQLLGFYPSFVHARLMIEAFGGAFIIGFLGTAGPRMASAPKLTPLELIWLLSLHLACGVCHLLQRLMWGDALFILMLLSLLIGLLVRVVRYRREPPPPQMLLALTGLFCGISGAALLNTTLTAERLRLGHLLLYQGLLLPPVLGIGAFVFPRMLGGDFGDPKSAAQSRSKLHRALLAALLLVSSFFIEVYAHSLAGHWLRALTALTYLLMEVDWRVIQSGSLTKGLYLALGMGFTGLVLAGIWVDQQVSITHLLYAGGFGLLMLIVGSRVLFGHSGDLEGFFAQSRLARLLVFLGVLAATTRATPAWLPSTTVSHHIYAAWTWGLLCLLWLIWHRKRFIRRDEEE